ncbi:MAG: EutN/CcmL family microcompartment protein [Thermoguttaceae bacterium]
MLHGKIIGTATSTIKHPTLTGCKLLIVRTDSEPVLAIDTLGSGIGDDVLISSDGSAAAEMVGTKATPVRWFVMGNVEGK